MYLTLMQALPIAPSNAMCSLIDTEEIVKLFALNRPSGPPQIVFFFDLQDIDWAAIQAAGEVNSTGVPPTTE